MCKLIILAAGQGTRLRPYTMDQPKCLVKVQGKSILDWQIAAAREAGIDDVVVVKGYLQEKINRKGVRFYVNDEYETSNMVASLWCARDEFTSEVIVSYADILYETDLLRAVGESNHEIAVAIDRDWRAYWERRFDDPLSDAESLKTDETGRIIDIGKKVAEIDEIQGQFIGLMKFRGAGVNILKSFMTEAWQSFERGRSHFPGLKSMRRMFMTDLLQGMIDLGHDVREVPVTRKWVEIDSVSDYRLVQQMTSRSNGSLRIHG